MASRLLFDFIGPHFFFAPLFLGLAVFIFQLSFAVFPFVFGFFFP